MNGLSHLRHRNERGASLVEMALVFPVLLFIMIATVEIGAAFRDYLAVNQAVREGVRTAAMAGDALTADCTVIEGLGPFLAPIAADVDSVQIYRAVNGNQVPGQTNTFRFTGTDAANCTHWTGTVQWSPTARQVLMGNTPLDYIGVRIRMSRRWITGFPPFSGSYLIDEDAITRMEPEGFE